VTGSITAQQANWTTTSTNLTDEINTKNAQVLAMEQTLNQQLQAADATSAELTNQQSELTSDITSLNFATFGYNNTNTGSS
jgi:predicted  nucleic acid-binding Zn-ribbon protein